MRSIRIRSSGSNSNSNGNSNSNVRCARAGVAEPLPVRALQWRLADADAGVLLWWRPAEGSTQDEYKVIRSIK